MKAIIISGMPAAGKTTVARIIAERFKLKAIGGGEILKEIAAERGYHPEKEDWWDTDEGKKFVKEREQNPDFDKEVDRRLIEKIKKGDIIVTSYTAPWIAEDGLKIWLNATDKSRVQRMSKRDGTDMKETIDTVKFRDARNADIYEQLYHIKFGRDKKPFHLIIETDNVTAEQVAEEIIKKIKELNI